jgi:hypothetical protein
MVTYPGNQIKQFSLIYQNGLIRGKSLGPIPSILGDSLKPVTFHPGGIGKLKSMLG